MGVTLYFQDEARVAHSIFMWLGICLCFTIGILSTRTITKKAFVPVKGSAFWKLEEKFKPHCFHVTFQVIGFVFVVLGAGMAYYQTEGRQEHLETYHSKAGALTIIVIILQVRKTGSMNRRGLEVGVEFFLPISLSLSLSLSLSIYLLLSLCIYLSVSSSSSLSVVHRNTEQSYPGKT
mmetsp:Transcript_24900/g.40012  ORF Transcript_24900/g.40012 Transcript_24900/m.40012 type:complete len:178 (-) Transcript_24900:690-1223(-)